MSFHKTVKLLFCYLLLVGILLLIFRPSIVALFAIIMLAVLKPRVRRYAYTKILVLLDFLKKYPGYIIAVQCAVYAIAYNALMPSGMYFSPDSVLYLSVSNIVPPTFSLLARGLVEIEVGLGGTHIVLLRYIVIAIYCMGGVLIGKALIRSGNQALAIFVLPALWSMSALTMWFNYFLTEGIASAFLVCCIGAYANMFVSTQEGSMQSRSAWLWLAMFVLFGMLAFTMRPAFAFVAPIMLVMMMNRTIFSWRRFIGASVGVLVLGVAHFSFAYYWHGEVQSKLGGVLTALVFDLPLPDKCPENDNTNLCRTQRALEPFIQKSRSLAPQQRFIYKAENNGNVFWAAMSAVVGNESEGSVMTADQYRKMSVEQENNMYSVIKEIAFIKIKSNIREYVSMVLSNSYYSVKTWGDWYKHDNLGAVAAQAISGTNDNVAAIRSVSRVNFDPTIKSPPIERIYKDYLFQGSRLLLNGHFVADHTFELLIIVLCFSILPFFFPTSVQGSILFACCLLGIAGTISQNTVFPVIPRLLQPFQALGALGALMLVSMMIDKLKLSSLINKDTNNVA